MGHVGHLVSGYGHHKKSDEILEAVTEGDFLSQPSWLLGVEAMTFMGLLACAGVNQGFFCPNHLDCQNYPFKARAWPLHLLQHNNDVQSHVRKDYENVTEKGIIYGSFNFLI